MHAIYLNWENNSVFCKLQHILHIILKWCGFCFSRYPFLKYVLQISHTEYTGWLLTVGLRYILMTVLVHPSQLKWVNKMVNKYISHYKQLHFVIPKGLFFQIEHKVRYSES